MKKELIGIMFLLIGLTLVLSNTSITLQTTTTHPVENWIVFRFIQKDRQGVWHPYSTSHFDTEPMVFNVTLINTGDGDALTDDTLPTATIKVQIVDNNGNIKKQVENTFHNVPEGAVNPINFDYSEDITEEVTYKIKIFANDKLVDEKELHIIDGNYTSYNLSAVPTPAGNNLIATIDYPYGRRTYWVMNIKGYTNYDCDVKVKYALTIRFYYDNNMEILRQGTFEDNLLTYNKYFEDNKYINTLWHLNLGYTRYEQTVDNITTTYAYKNRLYDGDRIYLCNPVTYINYTVQAEHNVTLQPIPYVSKLKPPDVISYTLSVDFLAGLSLIGVGLAMLIPTIKFGERGFIMLGYFILIFFLLMMAIVHTVVLPYIWDYTFKYLGWQYVGLTDIINPLNWFRGNMLRYIAETLCATFITTLVILFIATRLIKFAVVPER
jgi:hypothetical protein